MVDRGVVQGDDGVWRCAWGDGTPAYRRYHDEEWGRPCVDDRWLFEKICLEGFQAGLSWLTILNKRDNFRAAFADFDIDALCRFNRRSVDRLMKDSGIVRNRRKIEATLANAKAARALRDECGSLAAFVWGFEPDPVARPARVTWAAVHKLAQTEASRGLSRALKKRGFQFVGPTTMYALMQAAGVVNDHLEGCGARAGCLAARAALRVPGARGRGG